MQIRAASALQLPVPQAKKNTTKKRGSRGGYVTMISLLFPAEADKSTLTHHLVAQMANSKLKLVSHILIQNILSFYAD